DFNRIETNYLNAMGRLAEVEGETELYRDLRMKLFIDPLDLRQQYTDSDESLKALMNAFADGLNYFLHTHPQVTPKLITRFEPWMALSFSEGSIGGDIERVDLNALHVFYGGGVMIADPEPAIVEDPGGSNGFAIAPQNTASGNALLLINPHTSFFFRDELHVVSEEGLNAYGAVTWGQFFVYQGFNDRLGWMHTSSGADAIDEYLETVMLGTDGYYYQYGDEWRPFKETRLTLPYKTDAGMARREFTVYHSHHGPVIRADGDKWVSIKLMQEPVLAITQSFQRTKARNYAEFRSSMELLTNSSNNTVYADSDGNIGYFHGNFIPRRNPGFNWDTAVDGSNPATEWQGLHPLEEQITLLNPPNGWIQNTNNWPFSAAGEYSPQPQNYPDYMANFPENPRGINAVRVLQNRSDFSVETLLEAAYDPLLIAFEPLIPVLVQAWNALPETDQRKQVLAQPVLELMNWDRRYSIDSTQTTLAHYWGQNLMQQLQPEATRRGINIYTAMADPIYANQQLDALQQAAITLSTDLGSWQVPWGEVNRYQRNDGAIEQQFDDSKPSLPVAFASSTWGSLAAFGARSYPGTAKMYGTRGNSFVAAVEFG
ncbi:MAG: penicillin acylase family protein, partial [Pseudohongiellaceae bacterium]